MYYLLNDNRIIDSNDLPVDWKPYQVNFDEKNKLITLWCPDPRDRKLFEIKDQSKSVLDLIDWNTDLVEMLLPADTRVLQCKIHRISFMVGEYKYKHFIGIYKPDSKGNFIKAWKGTIQEWKN